MSIRKKEQRGGTTVQLDRLQDNQGRTQGCTVTSVKWESRGFQRSLGCAGIKRGAVQTRAGYTPARAPPPSPVQTQEWCGRRGRPSSSSSSSRLWFLGAACVLTPCAPSTCVPDKGGPSKLCVKPGLGDGYSRRALASRLLAERPALTSLPPPVPVCGLLCVCWGQAPGRALCALSDPEVSHRGHLRIHRRVP